MATKKKIPADGPEQLATAGHGGDTPEVAHPPVDFITKLEIFLEKNWKLVVTALVLFVIAVVIYFYQKYKTEDEMTTSNNAVTAADTRSDLESVYKKFPGTVAAGTALFEIADRQIKSDEPKAAVGTLQKFIADFPDHPLRQNALLGLGSIEQNNGDYAKAQEYFKQVLDGGGELAPFADMFRAETLISEGKLDEAKEIYDNFGPTYTGSPLVDKAADRMEALEKRIARRDAPVPPVEPAPEPKPEEAAPKPTPGAPNADGAAAGGEVGEAIEETVEAVEETVEAVEEAIEEANEETTPGGDE